MLESGGIRLSHALGQNFLVNSAIIDKILQLAEVSAEDSILEVGPGIGALTVPLLEAGAKVVSIEKDPRLKELLLRHTEFAKNRFTLIEGDALEITNPYSLFPNPSDMVSDIATCNKLVANLPYNIAATLVLNVFASMETIDSATVMVQKEVAERMKAQVGTKNYGAYTVKLRLYADVAGDFFVGRNNFLPAPRVDSAVIRLNRGVRHCSEQVLKNACRAADAAFFNRRKTILNSCKAHFAMMSDTVETNECVMSDTKNSKAATMSDTKIAKVGAMSDTIVDWLESCNIDPKIRGEKLDVQDYINLGIQFDNFFNKCNNE